MVLFQSCIQLMIVVGVLGCSCEGSDPGQPRAELAQEQSVASRLSAKMSGTVPCRPTPGEKILP